MLQLVTSLVNIFELPDSAQIPDDDLNAGTGELSGGFLVEHAGERDKAKFPRSYPAQCPRRLQPRSARLDHPRGRWRSEALWFPALGQAGSLNWSGFLSRSGCV